MKLIRFNFTTVINIWHYWIEVHTISTFKICDIHWNFQWIISINIVNLQIIQYDYIMLFASWAILPNLILINSKQIFI